MNLFWFFLSALTLSANAAQVGTYNLKNSMVMQSCFAPTSPDDWYPYFLGPADSNGRCLINSKLNCSEDQQFAVFRGKDGNLRSLRVGVSNRLKTRSICDDLGMASCDLLRIFVEQNSSGLDQLVFERTVVTSGTITSNESRAVEVSKVIDSENRFILPYNACEFFEVKYLLEEVK